MAAIRDRVRIRNSYMLRAFGAPAAGSGGGGGGGGKPSAPTQVGSTPTRPARPWIGGGWRGQGQGFSFLRFGR